MKYTSLALSFLYAVNASFTVSLRRRLSYERIAGYMPGSQVTDHCGIDRDQKAIEEQLTKGTNEAFQNALDIYKQGGNSKSYAQVTLSPALLAPIAKGTGIMGKSAAGVEVAGKAYGKYDAGDQTIKVQYQTTDVQSAYVGCQVGGLIEDVKTDGCLEENGTLSIDGQTYAYTYSPTTDNNNGRTIAGFSTDAQAKMRVGCKGCPYTDFSYFYDYYGTDNYADQWVMAALNGESTSFARGNADFSQYSSVGRGECVKKGTAYMNVFMYVIRELEDALDDCVRDCINCNDDPVHAWDEGVCFYTGSIEGQDGKTSDGKLLHQLADKRCMDYKTCGIEGSELEGTASLNYELFDLFSVGNFQLQTGNCPAARVTTKKITELMYIPLIQGTIRYAYKMEKLSAGEKEAAEGAVFAAAVLPRIHAASQSAAKTIYDNMRVGSSKYSVKDVKAAFESVYPELGINCKQVGGLWNDAADNYYDGMGPCSDASTAKVLVEEDTTLAIVLGSIFGAFFFFAVVYILFLRKREIQGKPVFAATVDEESEKTKPVS